MKNLRKLLLIFLLIIFIYIFYRSEIYHNSSKHEYYIRYYLIIIALFSIIFFSKNIKREINIYLIIIFVSSLSSLYIFEFYQIINKFYTNPIFTIKEDLKIKKLSLINEYNNLKKQRETNISIFIPPREFLDKKSKNIYLSGVSKSLTLYCEENDYYATYNSDRYGFSNPDYEWDNELTDILLVGDSFTHGACVKENENISSILRELSNQSILNLGFGGNGPLLEYATLKEYFPKKVKNILWLYFEGNDYADFEYEITSDILVKYINDKNFSQKLKLRQKEIDSTVSKIIKDKLKDEDPSVEKIIENNHNIPRLNFISETIKFLKLYYTRQLVFFDFNPQFENLMKNVMNFSNENGSKLVFIYLPNRSRYKTGISNKYEKYIKKSIHNLNIPIIDINETFLKEENPLDLFPKNGGHYNSKGYKLAAETIYMYLLDNGYLF